MLSVFKFLLMIHGYQLSIAVYQQKAAHAMFFETALLLPAGYFEREKYGDCSIFLMYFL